MNEPTQQEETKHLCGHCHNAEWHDKPVIMSDLHPGYCVHLTPEYWVTQGYERNWGDAAVMAWPQLEILKRSGGWGVEYLILNGTLRGPVRIMNNMSSIASF